MSIFTYTDTQLSCHNLRVTSVVSLILTACVLFLAPHRIATAQTVHIPDPGLRAVLESALGKEAGANITQSEMESLESLDAFDSGIRSLTGLEFATNLIELRLGNNKISNVSPLKDLTNLTWLSIKGNRMSDVSPLKNLTNLTYLHIGYNQISDVSPLKDLTNLTFLELDDNEISDISPLKNLTNLIELYLDDNEISDISPLENLTNLTFLNLNDNKISDMSTLKDFTNLIFLDIHGNQISDMSPLKNLKELSILRFHENQISDMSPLNDLKKLKVLKTDDNQISDVSPLEDLANLTELDLSGNRISDVSALKTLTKLRKLELDDNAISDLTPLKNLTNLTVLELDGNEISDLTPLKNLTKLTVLDLSDNYISDFLPITDLIDNLIEYDFSNQTEPPFSFADVNRDNTVNLADLVAIASNFADPDLEALARMNIYPDVNGDGLVNLIDLLIAASEIDAAAAAPTLSKNQIEKYNLTAKDLAAWIRLAKQLNLTEPNLQQGIDVLEQLLAILSTQDRLPKNTALLPNYPNPFNPETWIPYQLAKTSDVSISIHSADGKLVRSLELGQLPAGVYKHKSRAAYWDGRNELGESVASGVYFYTLTANDFKATGKMFIQK